MNDPSDYAEKSYQPEIPLELPTGYYLEHFHALLDTVESRYGDLLLSGELVFLFRFRKLTLHEQRLYVRLVSRKGPLFRSDKLSYAEIPDMEKNWRSLGSEEFLTVSDPALAECAIDLLTSSELRTLAKEGGLSIPRSCNKSEILKTIREKISGENLVCLLERRFQWLFPLHQETLRVFRMLFFGTPEPDLTAFVLTDLGKIRFEAYPLLSTHRLFLRRDEIERALRIRDLGDELSTALDEAGIADQEAIVEHITATLPKAEQHFLLMRWRRRILEKAGRFWERQGKSNRALELYSDPETSPARERRARLLFKMGKLDSALAACNEILRFPRDPEEEEVAVKLLSRITRACAAADPKVCPPSPGLKTEDWPSFQPTVENLVLSDVSGERIERRVLADLAARGVAGFEAENRFWTSLFSLVFWEIIYMPIPRAFGHPFQWGPADLFTVEFRSAREAAILERLADLTSDNSWKERIIDLYTRKYGTASALISWEALPMKVLKDVLDVLPARHLAAVCDRLSRNPGGFKTGFPDLFLFSSEPPGYVLAEVKSPNDRLQDNQRSWLRYFRKHDIPCRVIQVEYSVP